MLATKVGLVLALVFAALAATAMYTLAQQIPQIYTQDREVISLAASLLALAALYQFSDAIQVACAGALRGFQDTRLPMLLTMIVTSGSMLINDYHDHREGVDNERTKPGRPLVLLPVATDREDEALGLPTHSDPFSREVLLRL